MKKTYYVVYCYKDNKGRMYLGSCDVDSSLNFNSWEKLEDLKYTIKKDIKASEVIILNWKELK